MANRRSPSFFKILLDSSAPHLPLPPDFASTYLGNKIIKDPMIRYVRGGYSWRVKIRKIGESFCFSDGWSNVVEDINLGFGDFLVFRLVDKSIFDLVVFSPNGCEKDFSPKIDVHSGTVDDDDVFVVKDAEEDDDDGDDDDDVVVKDIDDVEEEIEDEDEDDDDDDDDDDEEEYEDEKDDGDDEEDDGDGDGDGDDDGGIDGDDGDPFFLSIISKSHKSMMRLPAAFVELAGINGVGTLTLKNVDGKEWQTALRKEKLNHLERYFISAGWSGFRRSNDISDGDECVFKFIRSEDKLLLARVNRKRRPAKQPDKHSGVPPETEVVARHSERKSGKKPAADVERKRVQPRRNSGKSPVTETGGGRGSRGRPAKRRRGKPGRKR
ncbi:hypothetical protein R6Q57_014951 [Mikania cordata]